MRNKKDGSNGTAKIELENILSVYPGLSGAFIDKKTVGLQGGIQFEEEWFQIRLLLPKFPKTDGCTLFIRFNEEYIEFNSKNIPTLKQNDVFHLIDQVPNIIHNFKASKDSSARAPSEEKPADQEFAVKQNIYSEIAELFNPDAYEILLNKTYTYIRFQNFINFEQHFLEIRLPSLEIVKHSLPDGVPWTEQFQEKFFTLSAYLLKFQKAIADLQPFYEELNNIDELCHVVQPSKPTTNDNWRLILLRKNVYLKLIIGQPLDPMAGLSVQIIGPSYEVEKLRKMYSEGVANWDYELDIQKNLLRIFDLCFFPMPTDVKDKEEEEAEADNCCRICLCYRLDDDVPIISCDNPKCDIVFHAECLKHWFSTLATGKEFLDVSFGICPYCKTNLSAAFNEILEN